MGRPFRDVGGPGQRVAAELAIQDFGGSVLGRPVTVRQADGQNRADISSQIAREWRSSTTRASMRWPRRCRKLGRPGDPGGVPRAQAPHLPDHGSGDLRHDRQPLSLRDAVRLRHLRAVSRHGDGADQGGRRQLIHHLRLRLRPCAGARRVQRRARQWRARGGRCARAAGTSAESCIPPDPGARLLRRQGGGAGDHGHGPARSA